MPKAILLKNKTTPKDPYLENFVSNGYSADFVPLLDHIHMEKAEIIAFLKTDYFLHKTLAFIITSQRAVEMLNECMSILKHTDPDITQIIYNKPVYTVGPATYRILADAGFVDLRGGDKAGNGCILAQIILNDDIYTGIEDSDKHITFFTGETRRDIIPKCLLSNNFQLYEKIVYKTLPRDDIVTRFKSAIDNIDQSQRSSSWVIFFSPQGTEEIVSYLQRTKDQFNIASIGPTTEKYLLGKNLKPKVVAPKPEPVSLLLSIQKNGLNTR